jgi:hypothetical protein
MERFTSSQSVRSGLVGERDGFFGSAMKVVGRVRHGMEVFKRCLAHFVV